MKQGLIFWIFAAVAIVAAFVVFPPMIWIQQPAGPSGNADNSAIQRTPVKILVNYGDHVDTLYANVTAGSNVFQIMQDHYNITYEDYPGMGVLITGINGIENSAEMFWMYNINGNMSAVGVSAYVPQAGDEIEFFYGPSQF